MPLATLATLCHLPHTQEDDSLLGSLNEEFGEGGIKSCFPSLTREERFYGVLCCLLIGFGCQVLVSAVEGLRCSLS